MLLLLHAGLEQKFVLIEIKVRKGFRVGAYSRVLLINSLDFQFDCLLFFGRLFEGGSLLE